MTEDEDKEFTRTISKYKKVIESLFPPAFPTDITNIIFSYNVTTKRLLPSSSLNNEMLPEILKLNTLVDIRDCLGKWMPAKIIGLDYSHRRSLPLINVSFLDWEEQWDETLDLEKSEDRERITLLHSYSVPSTKCKHCPMQACKVWMFVWVFVRKGSIRNLVEEIGIWKLARILGMHDRQLQVEVTYKQKTFRRWYTMGEDDLHTINWEPVTSAVVEW